MDIRVAYIKFQLDYPLSISSFNTSILVTISLSGLLIEKNKVCVPDLRLWLVIILFRSIIRLISRLYAEAVTRITENSLRMDVQIAFKVVDMLDIFGIVWFAVGNLLVFNNFPCINVAPIVFFSCLSYIVLSYINFFLPTIIRCTIRTCPPSRREDIEYMELTNNTVGLLRNQVNENLNIHANNSSELTEDRSIYWTNWLQSYGCYEVSYDSSMNLSSKAPADIVHCQDNNVGTHECSNNNGDDDVSSITCAICLSIFEHITTPSPSPTNFVCDQQANKEKEEISNENRIESNINEPEKNSNNNIIVRYPCNGHHYFHSHCLKSWLQVATIQYQNNLYRRNGGVSANNRQNEYADIGEQVTCPNCREHPIRNTDV